MVEFADDQNTLFFRVGERTLSSRRLSGQFPNYEAVLKRNNTNVAVVNSKELEGAIQRVAQFADERSGAVRLCLEDNELKISSQSTEAGESEDLIETPYSGPAITIGFNSSYIIDILKALGTGSVRLEFKDSQSAAEIRPDELDSDLTARMVLMPMRV
jgi:DNA polymerase III subunit beta